MVQHQPAPTAAAAGGGNASGTASGGVGAPTQAQPPSASTTPAPATAPAPTTPQPANNNGNGNGNTNNSIVSPSNNNNNVLTPVQAFAPAGQPIYNPQIQYMPSPHGHPHPSAHYQTTMVPTPLPGNVYVNNVTANVSLHGWSHTVPGYIPSGAAGGGHPQAHYISAHGEMGQVLQEQGNHLMHQMPQIPINPPQSHPSSRGRGQRRGRGGGGLRRQDYHNLRGHLLQPSVQQQPPTDSPSPVSNSLQLQSDQQPSSEAQMQALPYYTPAHPYAAYGTGIYFTHPQHPPNPAAAAAAQQATGQPLYMMYNAPMYNCGYIYQPVMQPHADYQYMPPEDQVVDERGQPQHQQPDGGPQLWHTMAPIYNDDYQQQQQQQHQQQQIHPNGGQMVVNDELNHNSTSLPSSTDTSSTMLSPNYPAIYDPQLHEMQQQMGVMHICAEDFSQMSLIHQAAGQYDDELADVAQAPPPPHGTIPVAWTTAGPLSLAADGTALMQPQPSAAPLHIIQQQQQQQTAAVPVSGPVAIPVPVSAQVCIDPQPTLAQLPVQQQQLPPQPSSVHPPQAQTPTAQPQQQSHAEPLVDNNLLNNNNNNDKEVALDEKLQQQQQQQHQQQQQIDVLEYQQQQQQQQQQQPNKVPNLAVAIATVAPQLQLQQQQQQPILQQQHQQQQTSPQQQQQQQQQQQHQQHSGNQLQQQQQQQPHHHQQQQQAQRKNPQQYNQVQQQQQQQVRRKYSSEYNHHHQQHHNQQQQQQQQQHHQSSSSSSNDTGIQTTKTKSWTNSSQHKKSTQSVAVTASPNTVNNAAATTIGNKSGYSHPTKTYTNQQHYQQQQQQQQQQHYHNYNNNNNNSSNQQQQPQMRTYGTMKVPSSPVASTAPTLERKNSQQSGATNAAAAAAAAATTIIQPQQSASGTSATATSATTTSTASITAAPNQFPQETTTPAVAHHTKSSTYSSSSSSSNYTAKPKHLSSPHEPSATTAAAAAATTASILSLSQPPLNLAPPPVPQTNQNNNAESAQPSWASLFASSKKPVAKVAPYEANKPQQQQQPLQQQHQQQLQQQQQQQQHPQTQQLSSLSSVGGSSSIATQHSVAANNAALVPQQLAPPTPHQQLQLPSPVPAPTTPLITPGTLSYSAASAQAVPPTATATATASASVKPLKSQEALRPAAGASAIAAAAAQLDEWTHKYADFLTRHKTPQLAPISLRPRGLTNRSNYCYINSILQALLGCSPFYNLLRSIPKQAAVLSEVKTPTVNAMMSFMTNFTALPSGLRLRLNNNLNNNKGSQNKSKDEFAGVDLQCDMAFEPTEIYKLWNDSREEHVEGRQEDAEEFLGYVLNKLNDEMLEVIKLIDKPNPQQNGQQEQPDEPEDDGDVWQMICNNRNKGSVTRQTDFGRTPISDIFRGELRSRLQREGEHSTDVIQPFFTLQLNIEKAASVKEALEILIGRDQLEGVTGSKTKQEVVAWQQMTLEKLPIVLILHLKYFDYRSDSCTKILKKVEFPVELKIDAKILGSKKTAQKQRAYRLFAVVYHDGKEASKGHYITDVFHTGYQSWLRYDDSSVKPISEKHVLQPHTPRVPYLLYYRRCDTVHPQTQQQQHNQQQQQTSNGGSGSGSTSASGTTSAANNK